MWGSRDPFAAVIAQHIIKADANAELVASMNAGIVPAGVVQIESFGRTPVSAVLDSNRPKEVTSKPFSWEDYEAGALDYHHVEVDEDWSIADQYTPKTMRISKVQAVRLPNV